MIALTTQWTILAVLGAAMWGDAPPGKDYSQSCSTAGCHGKMLDRKLVHDAAADDSCDNCHEPAGGVHKFKLKAPKTELCLECHDRFEGEAVHKPVAEGKCLDCHDPHATDAVSLLLAPTPAELCAKCHKDVTATRKFLHGPVATGTCTVCHDAHSSDHAGLLPEPEHALCLNCHETMKKTLEESAVVHAIVTEECIACHDPHGGADRMNLKAPAAALCVECHDGIADILADAKYKHEAVMGKDSCPQCHTPHAGPNEALLNRQPMELCLSCHDKPVKAGEVEMANIAELLEKNPNHHGPIRDKNCTSCHKEVHGGDRFRLLIADYPPEFYAPYDESKYAFCFECHESDIVRDARTDKLTNFRNGDQNLHYIHVNRKVKGRTCRSCHATHASDNERHIAESVPFGSWRIPINFTKTETGGSCLPGCHRAYRYERGAPVVNIPPG